MKRLHHAAGLFVSAAAVALIGAVALEGRLIGGPDDPGAPDFASLQRLATRNDALICPKSLCLRAEPDLEPPIFTVSAARLREKLLIYASGAPFTDEIRDKQPSPHLRFVQRASMFGAPLFIDILLIPRSVGASTLAMYARGRKPSSFDHAFDHARLRVWLDALSN